MVSDFLQAGAFVVVALKRICTIRSLANDVSFSRVQVNPYAIRLLRKEIDKGAFRIYGHWVKRGENQNRAALFENDIKHEIKTNAAR